jgi:hypothetical protein
MIALSMRFLIGSAIGITLISTQAQAQELAAPGAAALQTQPASIEQPNPGRPTSSSATANPFTQTPALQANPPQPARRSLIPESLKTPKTPKPVDPIDFFKVPPLDGGIKIRLGG